MSKQVTCKRGHTYIRQVKDQECALCDHIDHDTKDLYDTFFKFGLKLRTKQDFLLGENECTEYDWMCRCGNIFTCTPSKMNKRKLMGCGDGLRPLFLRKNATKVWTPEMCMIGWKNLI